MNILYIYNIYINIFFQLYEQLQIIVIRQLTKSNVKIKISNTIYHQKLFVIVRKILIIIKT